MIHLESNRTAGTNDRPLGSIDPDAFLIDDEFDDYVDRHVAAIFESLTDSRNV